MRKSSKLVSRFAARHRSNRDEQGVGPHTAVDSLDFQISEGEVVGFLGPNGAGKSTTLRILAGAIPPSKGRALLSGIDVVEQPAAAKQQVGYLPEIPPVYMDLQVQECVAFAAELKGIPKPLRKEECERCMKLAAVLEVRDRLVRNLSKGFRQRVGLAQALLGDPQILLLDEPTAGLDPIQIKEFRELLQSLASQGRTILVSTHILGEVRATCERVIMIQRGRIVEDDSIAVLEAQHDKSLEKIFATLALETSA